MKPKSYSFKCSKCEKRYTSQYNLKRHFEAHDKKQSKTLFKKFTCQERNCVKSYTTKVNLKLHIASQHVKDRSFKCQQCNIGCFSKKHLLNHVKTVHSCQTFSCTFCAQAFKRKGELYHHITSIHTKEKSYKCEKCEFACITSWSLTKHQVIHTDERRYSCSICGKKFKRRGDLREHKINVHTVIKGIFKCSTCSKTFKNKKNLAIHVKRKKMDKFECYFCSRSVSLWYNFVTHVRIHTDEKPYYCKFNFCQYSSGSAANLGSHIKFRHTTVGGKI